MFQQVKGLPDSPIRDCHQDMILRLPSNGPLSSLASGLR
jgi:hypothetical protein